MLKKNASYYTPSPNATRAEQIGDRMIAEVLAIAEATGESGCVVNTDSGAWFFFTVMTTIGYGNQSPSTVEGQAMIYTFGFLSILLFALVASQSGRITALLFDDVMRKTHVLSWFSRPFLGTLFWGILYWAWLALIGSYTVDWKVSRVGEEYSMSDAYWFAYISTTTVGLGDIFLEPEVLVGQDLLSFSFLFLFGFVFLAIFVGKLTSFIAYITGLNHVGGNTIEQSLADTSLLCGVVKSGAALSLRTASAACVKSGQMINQTPSSLKKPRHSDGNDSIAC